MRLFVAVEIDQPVRAAAAAAAERLRARLSDRGVRLEARWVPVDNLHITLWFIGEVDDVRGASITAAMQRPFPGGPFDLHLAGLGAFPSSGAPRVLWLGVRAGHERLGALHVEAGARLQPLGLDPERRPCSGHVTIARVKDAPRASAGIVRDVLAGTPADAGRTTVSAVTLFRSRVSARGATYEVMARAPLEPGDDADVAVAR